MRKGLTTGDPNKDSKMYLLDAAAKLGINLIDFYKGEKYDDSMEKEASIPETIYSKSNLSKVRKYSSNYGIKTNSLSYYLSRLSDKDVNHAFELKLFTLTDTCTATWPYNKFDFFESMKEQITEN